MQHLGGKTTQMAMISNNKAMITACEKNKIRLERLKFNLEKQGATRVSLIAKDSRYLDNFFSFEKILLDSPCSGSGTLDLSKSNSNFTEELVKRSVKTQKELIKKALKILSKKGEIIYSTCSVLKEENEEIIKEVLSFNNWEVVPNKKDLFKNIPLLLVQLEQLALGLPNQVSL